MWHLVCTDPNFDGTGQCTMQSWILVQGLLPPLSVEDAAVIGGGIAAVWALAFSARFLRKFLWR